MKSKGVTEKYELEVIPIAIGGKRLQLYTIRNWDPFVTNLEQKGEAYIKDFPFWVRMENVLVGERNSTIISSG